MIGRLGADEAMRKCVGTSCRSVDDPEAGLSDEWKITDEEWETFENLEPIEVFLRTASQAPAMAAFQPPTGESTRRDAAFEPNTFLRQGAAASTSERFPPVGPQVTGSREAQFIHGSEHVVFCVPPSKLLTCMNLGGARLATVEEWESTRHWILAQHSLLKSKFA